MEVAVGRWFQKTVDKVLAVEPLEGGVKSAVNLIDNQTHAHQRSSGSLIRRSRAEQRRWKLSQSTRKYIRAPNGGGPC